MGFMGFMGLQTHFLVVLWVFRIIQTEKSEIKMVDILHQMEIPKMRNNDFEMRMKS